MAIKELTVYDLPNTKQVQDGYDMKTVADLSAANIQVLMDKINEIIQHVNTIPIISIGKN